ncbi:MAG: endonuclease/exonuclease/phosphatase family protein [Spirochaetes bacterium]|nr:endonuclease/exonuclease/phosphatase family protein [Spirochaetota bacterium]
MTLNLSSSVSLPSNIIKMIKELDPDVISFQEAIYASPGSRSRWRSVPKKGVQVIQEMARALGYHYTFGYGQNKPPHSMQFPDTSGTIYWGPAVLSKHKILSTRRIPIGTGRILVESVFLFNGKKIKFYSTHLPPYWWPGYGLSAKRIKWAYNVRKEQIRSMIKFFGKKARNSVLAGDFNSLSIFNEMDPLMKVMNDGFFMKGKGSGATWPAYLPLVRVDYIFASRDFKILDCFVSDYNEDTDHRAVIADLQIK